MEEAIQMFKESSRLRPLRASSVQPIELILFTFAVDGMHLGNLSVFVGSCQLLILALL